MQGQAPQSPITGVPGWETDVEQNLLIREAVAVPAGGLIVEIGGEYGMSASLFAHAAAPDVRIITVDLFPGDLVQAHVANLAEAGFAGRTKQIKGDSKVAGKGWNEDIDLLFIDGDHSYEGALADLQIWAPVVRYNGGMILVHDCVTAENTTPHALHFEVQRAVDEWYAANRKDYEEVVAGGTIRAFKKIRDNHTTETKSAEVSTDKPTAPKAPAKPKSTTAKKKAAAK